MADFLLITQGDCADSPFDLGNDNANFRTVKRPPKNILRRPPTPRLPDDMAIPETMGERIQAALDRCGLSQSEAAKRLGLVRNTIGLWVNGADIPERQLARVAELVGETPAWLRYGVRDAREEGIERYVTGYERALDDVRDVVGDAIDRLQPPSALDAEPPAERIGRADEGTRPADGTGARKRPKRA
jgi:transcriptional regulator with XRE-family HTH domain